MDEIPDIGGRMLRRGGARLAAVVWVIGLLFGAGCGSPSDGEARDRVYFNPLERDARAVREVDPPSPPISLEDNRRLRRIVTGFRERAQEVFRRDDPDRPLDEIERIFQSTGEYLQLAAIYQRVVDTQGIDSAAAPRLAWILVRLGQQKQARELLDRLLEAQPENALVHFVDGSYWFNRSRGSREAVARAVVSWRRTLEIDPEFEGPERLNAAALRQKIRQIERRLSRSPEEILAGADDATERQPEEGGGAAQTTETGEMEEERSTDSEERASVDAGPAAGASRDAGATAEQDVGVSKDTVADVGPAVPVLATRADLAINRGKLDRAEELYRKILEARGGGHLGAEFGLIRVQFRRDAPAGKLAGQLEDVLDRDDLTAELAYEMGLFARAKLDASQLADQFWERVRELDPEYAESVGVGSP